MEAAQPKLIHKIRTFIPIFHWLPKYSKKYFNYDLFAGITLAAYAIPVSLAYATLAGLPPQYGVYGYLLGGIFYAMTGTSRQLAIGPTSAISLLIGSTLATMAEGDTQRWIDLASLTAMIFAILSVVFYLLRMSSIINFINTNVLLGFKAGAAITIGLTQLPKLLGVKGGGSDFFTRVANIAEQLPGLNIYVLFFGLLAIAIIIAGEKILPNKPVTIIIVILSIVLMSVTGLMDLGFKTVGNIPTGLPELRMPVFHWNLMGQIVPLAAACFLLAYIESVSAARTLSQKNNYEIDARQEMLALGVANLANSFGGGYPISGGLSQSAVNDGAGAKTPMSLIVASATIAVCLLFLTGLLKNLPVVILASIVFVAIRHLIDFKEFVRLYKVHKSEFIVAMIALISVIAFGILEGVIIAAIASLLLIIRLVSAPHVAFLGRIPGTTRYSDFKRHPDNEKIPGVLLFRVESPLLYFNVANIYNVVWAKVLQSDASLKVVVFDLSTSAYADSSGAKFIQKLFLNLKDLGISLRLAEAHSEVRDMLRIEDIERYFGHVSRRDSLHETIEHCVAEHHEWEQKVLQ